MFNPSIHPIMLGISLILQKASDTQIASVLFGIDIQIGVSFFKTVSTNWWTHFQTVGFVVPKLITNYAVFCTAD